MRMITKPKKSKRLSAIAKKRLKTREGLWNGIDKKLLWQREETSGWLSVPRAMPLLLQIMDSLSKGRPVSSTYLDLWCRTWDDSFVIANKFREMAFFSGFKGERAVNTWLSRIAILRNQGFINTREGASGSMNYILLYNPFIIIKEKHEKGEVNEAAYNSLTQHSNEMGITYLD